MNLVTDKLCGACGSDKTELRIEDSGKQYYVCAECNTEGNRRRLRQIRSKFTSIEHYCSEMIKFTDTCWLWIGPTNRHGYGDLTYNGKKRLAHQVVYELFVGLIPDDLVLDHICEVKRCVCPDHLEPVSIRENVRRYWKNHNCLQGHERTSENTIFIGSQKFCKTCYTAKRLVNPILESVQESKQTESRQLPTRLPEYGWRRVLEARGMVTEVRSQPLFEPIAPILDSPGTMP